MRSIAFWFILVLFPIGALTRGCVSLNEIEALQFLYLSTNGTNWTNSTRWMEGDPCTNRWFGITCDTECYISGVNLGNNNLVGYIPDQIINIISLTTLYLNGNSLYGNNLDLLLQNLTLLTVLDLRDNFLNGTVPETPPHYGLRFNADNNLFACPLPWWCAATKETQECQNNEGDWAGCCTPCVGNSDVYISNEGADNVTCGSIEHPCASLDYAAITCSSTSATIHISNGTYYSQYVQFNDFTYNITIEGTSQYLVHIMCDTGSSDQYLINFSDEVEYISISNVSFGDCTKSILYISGNGVEMNSITFNNNSIAENALILFGGRMGSVSQCTFINNTGTLVEFRCLDKGARCQLLFQESDFIGNDFGNSTGIGVDLSGNKAASGFLTIDGSAFANNSGWGYEGCVGYIGNQIYWNSSIECQINGSIVVMAYPYNPLYNIEISNSDFDGNIVHCIMSSAVYMSSSQVQDGENTTFWIHPIDYCGNPFNSTANIPEIFGVYFSITNDTITAYPANSVFEVQTWFSQTGSGVEAAPSIDGVVYLGAAPTLFNVTSGITNPNTTIAFGPNLSNLTIFCTNTTGTFFIQAKDAYGNDQTQEIDFFTVSISSGNETVGQGTVNLLNPYGTYLVQYTVSEIGLYQISVLLNNTWPINGSPFSMLVIGPSSTYSYLTMLSSSAIAGQSFLFLINYFDNYGYPLSGACTECQPCTNISVACDGGLTTPTASYISNISCTTNTTAYVNITIFTASSCDITVAINGSTLDPLAVTVSPSTPFPPNSFAFGPLLSGNATANEVTSINVQPKDRWDNLCDCDPDDVPLLNVIEGPVSMSPIPLPCTSESEGIYSGNVVFSRSGNYSLKITMDDIPVANGIFSVLVSPELHSDPCNTTCIILIVFGSLIGLILFILCVVSGYFIYKKIQKYRRMKRMIPKILHGKPLPTIMEILNDPEIPVLAKDEIVLGSIIGSGAQGMVWKGTHLKTNETVAVKQLHIGEMNKEQLQLFLTEIKLTSLLKHKNVCSFIGVIILSDGELGMVSKFIERGTLRALLYKNGPDISIELRLKFLIDVARGVKYLHSMKLIHRDLKPDNILIDNDWTAVIADFGCTTVLVDKFRTQTLVGTPIYIAPELLKEEKSNEKVDIYSLGVIINEVILMKEPYSSEWYKNLSNHELIDMIISGEARPEIDSNYHPQMIVLLEECWSVNSDDRPSAAELKRRLKRLNPNNFFRGWNVPKTAIHSTAVRAKSMPESPHANASGHLNQEIAIKVDVNNARAATYPERKATDANVEMEFL